MPHKRVISLSAFTVYLAAIAYLCFAKPDDIPHLPEYWFGLPADELGHFLMFMPFPFLGHMAFCHESLNVRRTLIMLVGLLAAGAAVAVCTEQAQALLQYRSADFDDLVADVIGLSSGGVVTLIYIILKKRA